MAKKMNKSRRILLGELAAAILLTLLIVIAFESGLLMPGSLSGHSSLYYVQMAMQLTTLFVIPTGLYLLRNGIVKKSVMGARSEGIYILWASVRMLMLCVPLVLNILFYYLYGSEVGFFYLAVVLFLALYFVYPSEDRCKCETSFGENGRTGAGDNNKTA